MKKELIAISEGNFAEIFQENQIKFAFISETRDSFKQQHGLVLCRDFLLDILHAEETKTSFEIWGFKWDPTKKQIDRDKTKLLITFPNSSYLETLEKNLHLLHAFEKQNKLLKTKIIKYSDKRAVIIGSRQYLKKSWALSFYTFLLKAYSITEHLDELTGSEKTYVYRCGIPAINKLKLLFKYLLKQKTSVSGVKSTSDIVVHDSAGFVSVLTGNSANANSVIFCNA